MNLEHWHWLDTGANDAFVNMAVDEELLQGASQRRLPLLRVYEWARPSVSIGYFQEYPSDYESSHDIVRRSTGGGLVFHGQDLTFTFITPRDHEFYKLCICDCYQRLHARIAQALNRIGLACALHSDLTNTHNNVCFESPVPHDIVLDGHKICGGAQRRTKFGLLHQGSLLLLRSQRRPVEELKAALNEGMGIAWEALNLSALDQGKAETLARSKYATETWNKRFTEAPRSGLRPRAP